MLNLLAASIIACASLTAVDGVRMRDMGPGAPNKSGYDAPEIGRAQCAKEKLLGEQAKLRLRELLDAPGIIVEDSGARDRHGRPLVWVKLRNGTTAGEVVLRDGYAVAWRPGYRTAWCE